MSRFLTAYQTTACKHYSMSSTEDALRVSFIKGDIHLDEKSGCLLVTGFYSTQNIPSFFHPIHLEVEGQFKTFVDVRSCTKLEPHTSNYLVKDNDEFKFITMRGHLDGIWNTDLPTVLRDVSKLPMAAYANLMGSYIERTLALDPRDTLVVTVLAAAFYLNLFLDKDKAGKTDAVHMSGLIANNLSMRQPAILDIIENHTVMNDLNDFCNACKEVTQSVRLNELNAITLFGIMGGLWYGNNGRELINVALEHPPTWMTLIYRAINSRGYYNSGLAKFLERGIFRKLSENYSQQVQQLLDRRL